MRRLRADEMITRCSRPLARIRRRGLAYKRRSDSVPLLRLRSNLRVVHPTGTPCSILLFCRFRLFVAFCCFVRSVRVVLLLLRRVCHLMVVFLLSCGCVS